jgi:hypothetical protein
MGVCGELFGGGEGAHDEIGWFGRLDIDEIGGRVDERPALRRLVDGDTLPRFEAELAGLVGS